MNLEFIKPQNLGSLLMKSSQSNFNLRSPGSYLVRSYLITTVPKVALTKELVYIFWTIFWGCEPTVGRGEIRVEPPNTS